MPEHHSFLYGPVNRLLIHLFGPPPVEKMSPGAAALSRGPRFEAIVDEVADRTRDPYSAAEELLAE